MPIGTQSSVRTTGLRRTDPLRGEPVLPAIQALSG
jgi:hypothetical protein